jgi:hypothetical protein
MTLTYKSLAASAYAKDELVATYLASEAIEYVRQLRDTARLQNPNRPDQWLNNIPPPCRTGNSCELDVSRNGTQLRLCSGTCSKLYFDNTTGVYGFMGGGRSEKPYRRTIRITEQSVQQSGREVGKELRVVAEVSWQTRTFPVQRLELEERLFNW